MRLKILFERSKKGEAPNPIKSQMFLLFQIVLTCLLVGLVTDILDSFFTITDQSTPAKLIPSIPPSSSNPTLSPSLFPTRSPITTPPSHSPTVHPITSLPSQAPSPPTQTPSKNPTLTGYTYNPTSHPTTVLPSTTPTIHPTYSPSPPSTSAPNIRIYFTKSPTFAITQIPTSNPSNPTTSAPVTTNMPTLYPGM